MLTSSVVLVVVVVVVSVVVLVVVGAGGAAGSSGVRVSRLVPALVSLVRPCLFSTVDAAYEWGSVGRCGTRGA